MAIQISKERSLGNNRFLISVCLLSIFMLAGMGFAESSNSVVTARAVTATDAAHPGSAVKAAVVAQVAPGYHINDHKPTLDYLIPTEVKLDPNNQFTVKNLVYPKGTAKKFVFSDVPLSVYEGAVVVGVLLESGKGVAPGTYTLKGNFVYQACNDHACLAPTRVPFTLDIKIVPGPVPLHPVESDVFRRIKFQ